MFWLSQHGQIDVLPEVGRHLNILLPNGPLFIFDKVMSRRGHGNWKVTFSGSINLYVESLQPGE